MDDLLERYSQLERDAARWKREEKALRETERRFYAVFDNPVFLVLIVVRGRIRQMNRRAEEILGFSLRDRPSSDFSGVLAPGSARPAEALLDPRSGTETATLRLRGAKDREFWIDVVSLPVEYSGEGARLLLAVDATDRETCRAELSATRALHQSTERSLFCERSGLNGALLDPEGKILCAGGGFLRMCRELFGLDAGEGAPLFNVLPESASGMLKELWNTALSGADVAGTMDSPCSLSARFVPLPDARGQVSSVMLSLSAGENAPAGTEPQSPDLRAPGDALLQDAAEWAPVMLGTLFVGASLSVAGNSVFRAAFGLEERPPAPMEPARFFPSGQDYDVFLAELRKKRESFVFPVCLRVGGKPARFVFRGRTIDARNAASTYGADESDCRVSFVLEESPALPSAEATPSAPRKQTSGDGERDSVTGLPGASAFEGIISREVTRSERYRGSLSLLLLRIDDCAVLFDRLPEGTRNGMLREFTALLKARIRPNDFLGRWRDDSFAILTPLGASSALQLAEKIRDLVRHYTFAGDIRITASLGAAELRSGDGVGELTSRASSALGNAVASGGDRVQGAL